MTGSVSFTVSNLFCFTPQVYYIYQQTCYCIKKDKNRILFLDRWFLKPDHVDIKLLSQLRDKYRDFSLMEMQAAG